MLSRWAEHNRRTAERRLARWQGLAVLFVLAALCAFLSGCLTPAALAEMAQRADVLSQGAKTKDCAEAAAKAAEAVLAALEAMSAPAAMRSAEVACIECVHNRDCSSDQDCVSGHCMPRRK